MSLIADALLFSASFGAALYCAILAQRLRRFTGLEGEMGSAIALLSVEVDEMTRALALAQQIAAQAEGNLARQTQQAEALAMRLELLVAALHDVPSLPAEPDDTEERGTVSRMRRRVLRRQNAVLA